MVHQVSKLVHVQGVGFQTLEKKILKKKVKKYFVLPDKIADCDSQS